MNMPTRVALRSHKQKRNKAAAAAAIAAVIALAAAYLSFATPRGIIYELAPSFLPNSSNYYLYLPQLPPDSNVFVFPNNTTAIYQTMLFSKNPVSAANTVMEMYAFVEIFPNASQANAALNFKKQLVISAIASNSSNTAIFPTPKIGSSSFGFEEPFYGGGKRLYVVNFVYGNAYVRVGVYETLNSSADLPIALAEKFANQISS
jgi:hypothetical protein